MLGLFDTGLAIVRALANAPRIVLADEPTGNLDSRSGEEVFDLMRDMNRASGVAFVMITHDDRLAQAADRILRKHGRHIAEKQFATKRLAEIMIDLFVLACTLSRVQASIDARGVADAAREIDILHVFTREARVRMKQNFRRIDNNDDELLKALADDAFETGRFRWDTI